MKLIKKIRYLFKNDTSIEPPKFIIAQKSCPHCASRGCLSSILKLKL